MHTSPAALVPYVSGASLFASGASPSGGEPGPPGPNTGGGSVWPA